MSMTCWMVGLSARQAVALRAAPPLAGDLAMAVQEDQLLAEALAHLPPEARPAAEARMRGAMARASDSSGGRSRIVQLGPLEPALDLQKSWHMLHYLLTGHADMAPASGDVILGGEPLGDDLGYGPARLIDTAATKAFAGFLARQDLAQLQARIDIPLMERSHVYGLPIGVGEAEARADVGREVAWSFPALKAYVDARAAAGDGLLTWIS